ncbi:DoxX family membrane protein [Streptomyces sp. ME19-01-6]|uniref:DoxX family membrane protein n=1 Tax=Streptomyces sp. ME19-01-6 TaxID=3028686 RepID=UPI0029B05DB5|nr:DoxX family membrane protein [Streptomyces sp. ME19-01-6]MDX3227228.1 DoxX family membrane protein [Streptomyces sp. ME19-01-6]
MGGRAPGFDDEPQLTMTKVPSDPAQVTVNPASFRVRLAAPVVSGALADTTRLARVPSAARRRPPVVWSGRTRPGGDAAATRLLQAVRYAGAGLTESGVTGIAGASGAGDGGEDATATQVLPRLTFDDGPPTVVGPRRSSYAEKGHLPAAAGGAPSADGAGARHGAPREPRAPQGRTAEGRTARRGGAEVPRPRRHADSVRHAYYPGRRMNLGVVLLPLRIFLGLISIYAGMGKLSDPVYFDGGERGSMVTWLRSLHPWPIAEPLRDVALGHPVGAGLTVAFLQVVVGVLTVLGLWQRLAACFGASLSAALILTVSWRTVPVYDAPDIIYLAAWSPLIIAGAPVYSTDSRLAGEAWRRLGPRVGLWALRWRVLRRGGFMALIVVGMTLLLGSMLGGAVRASETVRAPEPSDAPTNNLPGSPLPRRADQSPTGATRGPLGAGGAASPRAPRTSPTTPSAASSAGPPSASGPAGGSHRPSPSQGGARTAPGQPRRPADPATTEGPSSAGGRSGRGGLGSGEGETWPEVAGGSGGMSGDSYGYGEGSPESGGALGGLLG